MGDQHDRRAPRARRAETDADRAFAKLYAVEAARMVRVAVLLVDSRHLAEEAVQDSFAKVWQRWGRLDDAGAYLHRCVVNRCRDLQRRRRLESDRRPDPTATYTDLAAHELTDALAALPYRQRAAIVLRFYADLTEADTAAALGMATGTVKSNVHRGLAALRKAVER